MEHAVWATGGSVPLPAGRWFRRGQIPGVPAEGCGPWPAARRKQAELLLEFVRERGAVHPREVDDHFSHGAVKNYWGGSSNATTHLLDAMHYRGMLRVARREGGVRFYTAHQHG